MKIKVLRTPPDPYFDDDKEAYYDKEVKMSNNMEIFLNGYKKIGQVNLTLNRINIITGLNGSGKSTLIKLLYSKLRAGIFMYQKDRYIDLKYWDEYDLTESYLSKTLINIISINIGLITPEKTFDHIKECNLHEYHSSRLPFVEEDYFVLYSYFAGSCDWEDNNISYPSNSLEFLKVFALKLKVDYYIKKRKNAEAFESEFLSFQNIYKNYYDSYGFGSFTERINDSINSLDVTKIIYSINFEINRSKIEYSRTKSLQKNKLDAIYHRAYYLHAPENYFITQKEFQEMNYHYNEGNRRKDAANIILDSKIPCAKDIEEMFNYTLLDNYNSIRKITDKGFIIDGFKDHQLLHNFLSKNKIEGVESVIATTKQGFPVNDYIFFMRGSKKHLCFDDLANGHKMIFTLFCILSDVIRYQDLRRMVIIDEPELHIHPELQIDLAEIIVYCSQKLNIHFAIATHSILFIDAIRVFQKKYKTKQFTNTFLMKENDKSSIPVQIPNNDSMLYDVYVNPFQKLSDLEEEINVKD